MKYYTCEHCDLRVEEDKILHLHEPNWPGGQDKYLEFMRKMGEEPGPVNLYHRRFNHGPRGTSYWSNCGPLHEETEQEYFIFLMCPNGKTGI